MKRTLLLFVLLFTFVVNSQSIFRDNFSAYTTDQQLSGQGSWTNNSALPGGLGICTGLGCLNAKVMATPISYNGYGSSANSVQLKQDTDGCGTAFTATNSTEMYLSMVLNISYAPPTAVDFFRVMAGSNLNTAFRVVVRSFTGGFYVGVAKAGSANVFYYSSAIAYNANHLIVIRYTRAAGTADDIIRMYVNPIITQPEPATADTGTAAGTDATGSFDRMTFRQNAAQGLPTGIAGLVSISGSWSALRFPILSTDLFVDNNLKINTNNIQNGFLEIYSNKIMNNADLKTYDIQGKLLENKIIVLTANDNKIAVNPITNSGIYILEITDENGFKQIQKIIVN
ncbi:MAG: T9SS type A sorting domain-containing protein [Flavobacterium sp.]|nr:T9SS type A sorting domain-containing protein [Flavobacterium sp.]